MAKIDYTNKDYESFRNMMIDELRIQMPEYTDLSQTDAGIVILELLAKGLDILSYYQDVQANEAFLPTAQERESAMNWADIIGYAPRNATPARFKQVFVLSEALATDYIIPAKTILKTEATATEESVYFETDAPLVIPAGKLGNEQTNLIYDYTVNVTQGLSISNELVGSSNGAENQRFKLAYKNAIIASITLLVNIGFGYEVWTRVDNFIESTPTSKHYKVAVNDHGETIILFGNGATGMIPDVVPNGIRATYRIGGGSFGNVTVETINTLLSPLLYVEETFNPETAFELGTDRETLAELKNSIPAYFRSQWKLITLQDYSSLVQAQFSSVKSAEAIIDETDIDNIILYILTKDGANPSVTLATDILSFIGERQIIGKTCEIEDYIPEVVDITLTAYISGTFQISAVTAGIEAVLTDFFLPQNRVFGETFTKNDLEDLLVREVAGLRLVRVTLPADDIYTAPEGQIFELGTVTINTSGGV